MRKCSCPCSEITPCRRARCFTEVAALPKCMGTGYSGRLPIYEIFVLTPDVEKAIEAGLPHSKIKEVAVQGGMVELAIAGLEAAMAGKTTIEEVYFKLSS